MNNEKYENPFVEVVQISAQDIITESGKWENMEDYKPFQWNFSKYTENAGGQFSKSENCPLSFCSLSYDSQHSIDIILNRNINKNIITIIHIFVIKILYYYI